MPSNTAQGRPAVPDLRYSSSRSDRALPGPRRVADPPLTRSRKEADLNGEWIDIVAPTQAQAEQLAETLQEDFGAEVVSNDEHVVRVTPDSETTAKLVSLFNAIGTWLTGCGLSSCDVRFGEGSLTLLPASEDEPGDPTAFLIERTRQLELALSSRIVIEQAKGILAERHGVGIDEAFEQLRSKARSSQRNIHEVAEEVVEGKPDR